jgi:hypothetical protein
MSAAERVKMRLSEEQEIALPLLLAGEPDRVIAAAAGVHRGTLHRWRTADPLFMAEVNRERLAARDAARERLRGLLSVAVDALEAELRDPSVRSGRLALATLAQLGVSGDGLDRAIGSTDPAVIAKQQADARRDSDAATASWTTSTASTSGIGRRLAERLQIGGVHRAGHRRGRAGAARPGTRECPIHWRTTKPSTDTHGPRLTILKVCVPTEDQCLKKTIMRGANAPA